MKPLTDVALAAQIERDCKSGDVEIDHIEADWLIIKQHLEILGYKKAAEAWKSINKWYA